MELDTGYVENDGQNQMLESQWNNLPSDILDLIVNHLLLIEFFAFRGVCKSWRWAASNCTTTKAQTMENKSWILIYTEQCMCWLHDISSRKVYKISIPELKGASCISSKEEWLLVHRQGHVFFFNPFSRAKINLPKFPHNVLSNHVATFSSFPTLEDCRVFVVNRMGPTTIEVNTCSRGDTEWIRCTSDIPMSQLGTITYVVFSECDGLFYYMDSGTGIGAYDVREKSFKYSHIAPSGHESNNTHILRVAKRRNDFGWLAAKFEEKGVSVSISTCGTSVKCGDYDVVYSYEHTDFKLKDTDTSAKKHCLKVVWVKPCFTQLSYETDYRWST